MCASRYLATCHKMLSVISDWSKSVCAPVIIRAFLSFYDPSVTILVTKCPKKDPKSHHSVHLNPGHVRYAWNNKSTELSGELFFWPRTQVRTCLVLTANLFLRRRIAAGAKIPSQNTDRVTCLCSKEYFRSGYTPPITMVPVHCTCTLHTQCVYTLPPYPPSVCPLECVCRVCVEYM